MNTWLIHPEFRPKFFSGQRPQHLHLRQRPGIVDPLHTILKTFHAIRGGHADLDKHLQHLDALLISASQPPDDMDIGQAIMRIGQHQKANVRRNAARHKRITDLLPRSVAEFYAVYARAYTVTDSHSGLVCTGQAGLQGCCGNMHDGQHGQNVSHR